MISNPFQPQNPSGSTLDELNGPAPNRRKFVEDVFSRLQHVEHGIADDTSKRTNRYLDDGNWFVQRGYAVACLLKRLRRPSHQPILAGVSLKGLGRLFQSYARNGSLLMHSIAAAVNVRQRVGSSVIRSFYPDAREPVTAKVSPAGPSRLKAEVENRRIVEEIKQLCVPRIIDSDFGDQCPFLIEEFVSGRLAFRRNDKTLLIQTVLPSLQRHYAAFGVTCGTVHDCFEGNVVEQVQRVFESVSWDPRWQDRGQMLSVVARLVDSQKHLCMSFCHGDLSAAHVAISDDGRALLLDWESAGVQPIAFDFVNAMRTFRINPAELYQVCETMLGELSRSLQTADLFTPPEQMFLASLRRFLVWDRFRAQYEILGEDATAALHAAIGNANELLKHVTSR